MANRVFNLDNFVNGNPATNKLGQTVIFSTMLRNFPGKMMVAIKRLDGYEYARYAIDGNRFEGMEDAYSLECA